MKLKLMSFVIVHRIISLGVSDNQFMANSLENYLSSCLKFIHISQPIGSCDKMGTMPYLLTSKSHGRCLQDQYSLSFTRYGYFQGDLYGLDRDRTIGIMTSAYKPGLQSIPLNADLNVSGLLTDYIEHPSVMGLVVTVVLFSSV